LREVGDTSVNGLPAPTLMGLRGHPPGSLQLLLPAPSISRDNPPTQAPCQRRSAAVRTVL